MRFDIFPFRLENMTTSVRRTIYLLVITLVINLGGWTFNKEAWADVLLDEQQSVSSGGIQSSVLSGEDKSTPPEAECNHWCHAIGHFIGLFSHLNPVTPEFSNGYSAQQSLIIQFSSPDGPFRPPRLLS